MAEKNRPVWLRLLGYTGFFLLCFLISLVLTFPMETIKPRILGVIEQAVQQAGPKPGRHGTPSQVKVDKVALAGVNGVELQRLSIQLASTDPEPSPSWELDRVEVSLRLLPLLWGARQVGFDVDLYGGNISGEFTLAGQHITELSAEAAGLALAQIPVLIDAVGIPIAGELQGQAELRLGKTAKEAEGKIVLRGSQAELGPGKLSFPGFGDLTLPGVNLGELRVEANLAEGKCKVTPVTIDGKDAEGKAEALVTLRQPIGRSSVTGSFQFGFDKDFLKANSKVETILSMAPPLKRAKDTDGTYHFKLSGSLGRLRPTPDRKATVN